MHRIIPAVAMSALLLAASAVAAPGDSVVVQGAAPTPSGSYQVAAAKVAYGDLDVSTNEGAKSLLARIDAAAQSLCGTPKAWQKADPYELCRKRAVTKAVRSVDSAELTKVAATP